MMLVQELAVKGPERERLMAAVDAALPTACNVGFITEHRHRCTPLPPTLLKDSALVYR